MFDRSQISIKIHQNNEYSYLDFDVNQFTVEAVFNKNVESEVSVYIFEGNQCVDNFTWEVVKISDENSSIILDSKDRDLLMKELKISYEETVELVAIVTDYLEQEA